MNTIENNEIIASFMGIHKSKIEFKGIILNFENSKYNTYQKDWNMLMPVIEKIEMLPCDKTTDQFYLRVEYDNREDFKGWYFTLEQFVRTIKSPSDRYKTKIEGCYIAVIEFIKWYNQNKPI